jgi:hypothetical protein
MREGKREEIKAPPTRWLLAPSLGYGSWLRLLAMAIGSVSWLWLLALPIVPGSDSWPQLALWTFRRASAGKRRPTKASPPTPSRESRTAHLWFCLQLPPEVSQPRRPSIALLERGVYTRHIPSSRLVSQCPVPSVSVQWLRVHATFKQVCRGVTIM